MKDQVTDWKLLFTTWYGAEVFIRHNGDGTVTVRETMDVEPFLEDNVAMANHDDGWSEDKYMRRCASIPLALLDQWKSEGLDIHDRNNEKIVKRILNDPDYRKLRTAHWNV